MSPTGRPPQAGAEKPAPLPALRPAREGVSFDVRVVPRASRTELAGVADGTLRVRLSAPPVDDAANRALIELLARALSVQRQQIHLVAGGRSRTKRVLVTGMTVEDLTQRFKQVLTRA